MAYAYLTISYAVNAEPAAFLLRIPIKPAKPEPNNQTAPGTGTGDVPGVVGGGVTAAIVL